MNKHKQLVLLGCIGVMLILGMWIVAFGRDPMQSLKVYQVYREGIPTPHASVVVNYGETVEGGGYAMFGLDLNQSGDIGAYDTPLGKQEEWVAWNVPIEAVQGSSERFTFALIDPALGEVISKGEALLLSTPADPSEDIDALRARARVSQVFNAVAVSPEHRDQYNTLDKTGLRATGMPNGIVAVAHASSHEAPNTAGDYYARHLDVPDQDQLWNECAPTAIANSFRFLAKTYGLEHLMPKGDVNDLIDEIKGDVAWDDGVAHEHIISGKQTFIARHALPIEAHQIGHSNDEHIVRKMAQEIEKGQAIEAWLEFFDASGAPAGAHLVTVVGAGRKNGKDIVRFTDPDTRGQPTRDLYEVEGGNYLPGYWPGAQTYIRYAYAQSPISSLVERTWVDPRKADAVAVGGGGIPLRASEEDVTLSRSRSGFFSVSVGHPGDHEVGTSFTVRATVRMTHKVREVGYMEEDEPAMYQHEAVSPWSLTGSFLPHGALTPSAVPDAPPYTMIDGERYSIEQTFTCTAPGFASVSYVPTLTWQLRTPPPPQVLALSHGAEFAVTEDTMQVESPVFRCVDVPKKDDAPKTALQSFCPGISEDASSTPQRVLRVGHSCYLATDFHVAKPDQCDSEHWHASQGRARALDGAWWTDPSGCGLGKVSQVMEGEMRLSADQYAPYVRE